MVVRKKKKVRKYRGKRHYGYGVHKKHRGGGSRGGRGKAGGHKHKWSYVVKYEPDRFGKRGFKRPIEISKKVKVINVSALERLAAGKSKIDVTKFGYDKVLGSGKLSVALEVIAKSFSKKAIEKIEASGGRAVLLHKEGEEKEEKTVGGSPAEEVRAEEKFSKEKQMVK